MTTKNIDCILLPVDASEGSLKAAEYAGTFAQKLGVELHLVYVHSHDAGDSFGLHFLDEGQKKVDFIDPDAFAEISRKASVEVFKRAKAELGNAQELQIKEVLLKGDPAAEILEYLKHLQAPMVVMGRQGKSTLKEIFIGSVSQKLVHRAKCPVTLVT